jgi:hypothetical protein
MTKGIVSIGLFLVLACGMIAAQEQNHVSADESKILALENAWNIAEAKRDTGALDQMLASSFVYTEFDGTFSNKTQFLKSLKSAPASTDQITTESINVNLYGSTAIVTGIYREKGTENAKPFTRRGRFTDVWNNQNGVWLCIASQATLIGH